MRADTDLSVLAWIIDFARDALTSRSRRRLRGAFGQTALALDLDAELGGGRTARVFGTLRGYPVALRLTARGPRDDGTVAEVDVSSGLPPGLGLRVRVDATPSQVALAIDPELDRALVLTGDATRWLTLLDAPTRRRVRRLLPDGLSLQDGWLRVSVPERVEDAARLQRWLRELAALAEDLDLTRRPLALRLLQGARQAPEAAERARCLTALAAGAVDAATVERALRAADADADAGVRLVAAELAGPAGVPRLAALAQDGAVGHETRLAALDRLAALPPASLHPVLDAVLAAEGGGIVWRRAAALAARTRHRGALPALAQRAGAVTGEDALAWAEALVALEADEPLLVAALATPGAPAAAAALGFVGSRAAAGPLRRLAEGRGEGARAAREALARLSARLGDLGGGQLALAEGGAGRLAVLGDAPQDD